MSYTGALQRRNLLDGVVSALVVQEGNLFVGCGPAAWAVPSPVRVLSGKQTLALQLRQCQVIVAATGHAFATAVPEKDDFVAGVAQAKLAYGHLLVCQRTRLGTLLGPLSSFAQFSIPSSFPLHKRADDLLQLTLCETLEYVHDWRWDRRRCSKLNCFT